MRIFRRAVWIIIISMSSCLQAGISWIAFLPGYFELIDSLSNITWKFLLMALWLNQQLRCSTRWSYDFYLSMRLGPNWCFSRRLYCLTINGLVDFHLYFPQVAIDFRLCQIILCGKVCLRPNRLYHILTFNKVFYRLELFLSRLLFPLL